jgi:hypothetical protein
MAKSGLEIIEITSTQMGAFAGNCLEVKSTDGKKYVVISTTAHSSLSDVQLEKIRRHVGLIVIDIPTIERYGGGGVRCMIAENYFEKA